MHITSRTMESTRSESHIAPFTHGQNLFKLQAVTFLLLTCAAPTAWAHGYLAKPAARNVIHDTNYCPHCLNAGKPGIQEALGNVWPSSSVSGQCGDDPHGETPLPHFAGGRSGFTPAGNMTVWKKGSIVELEVDITTYHYGRMSFRICKLPGTSSDIEKANLNDMCLDQHQLVQADVPNAQSPGEPYYYLKNDADASCCWPPRILTFFYQLPQDLECDGESSRCVVQWRWTTGNTCTLAGTPDGYKAGDLPTCGEPGSRYPEEFFNCADVLIKAGAPQESPKVMAFGDSGSNRVASQGRRLLRQF